MLLDSHAHLDDKRFDDDRDHIIRNLKSNGVELVINIGADIPSSVKGVSLSEEYENIYATVGVHPHDAKDVDETTIELLRALAKKDKVVGIGEIGLDYHYDNSPRDVQRKWFREQIKLAKELKLPIVVHEREASEDVYNILKEESDENLTGVIHCFSGSLEMAREYIKMGFYISFAGPVTFKNAKKPKEVASEIPLDKILIETDSPYLTPEPYRGKRNDPTYVRYVAETIARLKDISYEEIVEATSKNAKKLFGID